MNSIIKEFTNNVEETFEEGVDKFNYDLKVYTGPALEKLGRKALELCCENLDIEYDSIDQKYLTHEKLDSLRLDDHLKIDGKIVIMQEDRAWMDKPFYSMKIHTINQIKTFPHGIDAIIKDCIFPLLTFSYDITEKTIYTEHKMYTHKWKTSYGESQVKLFNLSGHKRNSKMNYFYRGFDETEIRSYLNYIYNHLYLYKKGKLLI